MRYVTTPQRGDGFGATFHHYIYDILYAKAHGDQYVFTPQKAYEHNYKGDSNFVSNLNKYMGLAEVYPVPEGIVNLETNDREQVYKYIEEHLDEVFESEEFKKIQAAFFKDKKNPYDESYYNVAVHIRRINGHDTNSDFSKTPNIWYRKVMEYIASTYEGSKPIQFHIYSQRQLLELGTQEFDDLQPIYHIDEDLEESFTAICFGRVKNMHTLYSIWIHSIFITP